VVRWAEETMVVGRGPLVMGSGRGLVMGVPRGGPTGRGIRGMGMRMAMVPRSAGHEGNFHGRGVRSGGRATVLEMGSNIIKIS